MLFRKPFQNKSCWDSAKILFFPKTFTLTRDLFCFPISPPYLLQRLMHLNALEQNTNVIFQKAQAKSVLVIGINTVIPYCVWTSHLLILYTSSSHHFLPLSNFSMHTHEFFAHWAHCLTGLAVKHRPLSPFLHKEQPGTACRCGQRGFWSNGNSVWLLFPPPIPEHGVPTPWLQVTNKSLTYAASQSSPQMNRLDKFKSIKVTIKIKWKKVVRPITHL